MKGRMRAAAGSALLACTLAACATNGGGSGIGPKTAIGGLGGAAAGGLLGAALGGGSKGIAAGVILGGLVGGATGNMLDQRDQKMAAQSAQRALETAPTGTPTSWHNPDTGNAGQVTPERTYQTASGQYCREYTQQATIAGKKQTTYGTACRQPDGSWKVVS